MIVAEPDSLKRIPSSTIALKDISPLAGDTHYEVIVAEKNEAEDKADRGKASPREWTTTARCLGWRSSGGVRHQRQSICYAEHMLCSSLHAQRTGVSGVAQGRGPRVLDQLNVVDRRQHVLPSTCPRLRGGSHPDPRHRARG